MRYFDQRKRTSTNYDLPVKISRRKYLTLKAMHGDGNSLFDVMLAIEAVASTAIEHPEWDMNEEREWADWERS